MKAAILILVFQLASTVATQAPRFGWKKFAENKYALQAAEKPVQMHLPFKQGVKLRFDIDAEYGITFAVGASSRFSSSADFEGRNGVCLNTHILKASTQCAMPSDFAMLSLSDERKEKAKNAPQNKVTIDAYVWTCIENCPSIKKAAVD